MVQGLAAFLLGICYEFNWETDALISRATIQPIILSRIGLDHFAACITRVRESKPFKAAVPYMVVLPSEEGAGKLPGLFFDYSFVEFMKRTFGNVVIMWTCFLLTPSTWISLLTLSILVQF